MGRMIDGEWYTDAEMLGIALGAESEDEPIAFRVGESLSDLAEE